MHRTVCSLMLRMKGCSMGHCRAGSGTPDRGTVLEEPRYLGRSHAPRNKKERQLMRSSKEKLLLFSFWQYIHTPTPCQASLLLRVFPFRGKEAAQKCDIQGATVHVTRCRGRPHPSGKKLQREPKGSPPPPTTTTTTTTTHPHRRAMAGSDRANGARDPPGPPSTFVPRPFGHLPPTCIPNKPPL